MNLITLLPARYAKAITALIATAITYIETVGVRWDLKAALLYAGVVLGVGAVPNATATPKSLSGRSLVAAAPAESAPPAAATTPPPAASQGATF